MNERGWRRWRSCGLYVKNPGRKGALSQSDDHLAICRGNINSYVTKLSRSANRKSNDGEHKCVQFDVEPKPAYDDAIEWVDKRSELPPSLGWYSPRKGRTKGFYASSFEQSMEARSFEESLEQKLNLSFDDDLPSEVLEDNQEILSCDEFSFDSSFEDDFQQDIILPADDTLDMSEDDSAFVPEEIKQVTIDNSHPTKESQSMLRTQSLQTIPSFYNGTSYDGNGNKISEHIIINNNYEPIYEDKPTCSKTHLIHSGIENSNKAPKKIQFRESDIKRNKRSHSKANEGTSLPVDMDLRKVCKKMRDDHTSSSRPSPWQHHVWTSRDLRHYLVMKAKQSLGGDAVLPSSLTETSKADARLIGSSGFNPSKNDIKNLSSCFKRGKNSNVINTGVSSNLFNKNDEYENISTSKWLPKERIISWGGTFFPRDNKVGGSLRLKSHPAPRQQRLWSLPAIILTPSEEIPCCRNPSPTLSQSQASDASTLNMQYLQVPQPASAIHTSPGDNGKQTHRCSTPALKKRKSKIKSQEDLSGLHKDLAGHNKDLAGHHNYFIRQSLPTDLDITRSDTHLVAQDASSYRRSGKKPSHLNSLLSLYCDTSEDDDGDRSYIDQSGSPPPDLRPAIDELYDYEYEESYMYGRYSANLAEYARSEARRLRAEERYKDELLFSKELEPYRGKVARATIKVIRPVWEFTFARLGEDWVFLFVLGLTMATISFLIDIVVLSCFEARMYLQNELLVNTHWSLQLFAWVLVPTLLVIFSAAFCQWVAPSAAGSGIPEMKTILRGVILKEYLTWKTLIAKIVGLATVLGSGLPIGKEGPVMHMASILSTMLMSVLSALKGVVDNEAHQTDLLAAACTMGVAVSYAAPIGGVLFSIEVTAVYFAVRNYWRGFFAAVLGAMFYRLMYVWFMNEKTITPLFKVDLNYLVPYDVVELLPFLCIGIVCGFAGAAFVYMHRRYVLFIRQNKLIKRLLNKKRLLYPTFVAICISLTTFPALLGQFMASTISTKEQILELFSNVTWTVLPNADVTAEQQNILDNWGGSPNLNFHISLLIFQFVTIVEIAIASTLPVPTGLLIPLFVVGAAFGRQIGEFMYFLYPYGIRQTNLYPIVPGAYAMVGAASFVASITHTISISVITFELTGQITYVIPIMIGVLISNCIASLLQPSIYDSVIQIKRLPYLPDIITTSSDVYNIYVEDIMIRDVKYIWQGITFMDLKSVIKENRKLKHFPIVDKHDTMILLGSIPRIELVRLLVEQISSEKRRIEAKRRHLDALKKKWEEEDLQGQSRGKNKSTIHYEDEINSSSDEEEVRKNGIFGSFSKSLSRSLLSLARFKPDSNAESSDDSDSNPDDQDAKHEKVFDHPNPPRSPTVSRLKELFSSKTPPESLESRRSSTSQLPPAPKHPIKFTIGHDDEDDDEITSKDSKSENEALQSEEISSKSKKKSKSEEDPAKLEIPSNKKKTRMDLLKEAKKKITPKKAKDRPSHPEIRLTRSNSLGSIRTTQLSKPETEKRSSMAAENISRHFAPIHLPKRRSHSVTAETFRTINSSGGLSAPSESNYSTITVVDTKLRNAIEKVRKMKTDTASSMELKLSTISLFKSKKKEPTKKREFDMSPEEREVWELRELSKEVDFTKCHIDPSPFQLVERTTLLRVHSLFSMLGINHAFVTAIGKLVGVVALKELRQAIEGQYIGQTSTANSPGNDKDTPSTNSPLPTDNENKNHLSGTSPQRLSDIPPSISQPDPEVGPISGPSFSSNHLSPYYNDFSNR